MKASTRRKVSYVVKQRNEEQAHCLGVNSLALDPTAVVETSENAAVGGVLYSAGRDGVVAGWDIHMKFKREQELANNTSGDKWVLDREMLHPAPRATCKVFSQMHTDWVNDIAICKGGTCIVSASSDRTVKVWKPYSDIPGVAHTIGWHTDYVKCLAYASKADRVASAGLDKKINIWDIEHGQAAITIDAVASKNNQNCAHDTSVTRHDDSSKLSIYALAINPTGTIIATGSPEKVVRLWDTRSGKRIGKLTGHTDNIRALLISDDGKVILSGSSDSTIKLWSVKSQRCLTTYETHPDSVWALYSDHPDLKTFYAGSRDGLVTKTEILNTDTSISSESECVGLFKEKSGVVKIVALQDAYVWTATSSSSVNRWLSVPSRETRQVLMRSEFNPEIPSSAIVRLPHSKSPFSAPVPDPFLGSDNLTLYAGSIMSIPVSYHEDEADSTETLVPVRETPDDVIEGKPGIVSHLVLQNRRQVLTQDTNGNIALWDLVKCTQLKMFGRRSLEEVAKEISNIESFPAWCSVDTKIGAITVQLHEFNCFDCEMYADEADLPDEYEIRDDQRKLHNRANDVVRCDTDSEEKTTETGASIGKLDQATQAPQTPQEAVSSEKQSTEVSSTPARKVKGRKEVGAPSPLKLPLTAITTNGDKSPFHPSSEAAQSTDMFRGPYTAPPTTSHQFDYFSGTHHLPQRRDSSVQIPPPAALTNGATSPTSSTFINRLKNLSVKAKLSRIPSNETNTADSEGNEKQLDTYAEEDESTESKQDSEDDEQNVNTAQEATGPSSVEDKVTELYNPPNTDEFPPLSIPPTTTIIIAEESAEASTGMDLYRGTVATAGDDADLIVKSAPSWLLSYLLYSKTPNKETVKLTFILKRFDGTSLPELPGGPNNRLLANRVLRVRKLIQYVIEKLELDSAQAERIELLCGDTVLTPTTTLATIKQHILKSSGDIPLSYRYKDEGVQATGPSSSTAMSLQAGAK
ncbi:hypothetical protein EC973_008879 [Apophysomyces ossiformis]|uniref:WD repeat protein n=1 Tax=Apophysomyces ossiformis TaxID=679940 RepID=A0A8H7BZ12_9FUNG|nr:hypothetical protein EC973_008879 [Apophysomyces ossiformis]